MRSVLICILFTGLALTVVGQDADSLRVGPGSTAVSVGANLPVEKIGQDDLIGVNVYDSPELTRTVRVNSDGDIRLPMLHNRIRAAGLYPSELEEAITKDLVAENVLVDPIVTVFVAEYRSRPVTVVGCVKNPTTFQAAGNTTLLDAISVAGGMSDCAGREILISSMRKDSKTGSAPLIQRIPVGQLISGEDPSLNIQLEGGEEIRVPEAGQVYVLGNVKKPGAFPMTGNSNMTVLKAIALSEGLDSFPGRTAYIYRAEGGANSRSQIPIDIKKVMARKDPDIVLAANDILYVPGATGAKAGMKILETSIGIGAGLGSALIYVNH